MTHDELQTAVAEVAATTTTSEIEHGLWTMISRLGFDRAVGGADLEKMISAACPAVCGSDQRLLAAVRLVAGVATVGFLAGVEHERARSAAVAES